MGSLTYKSETFEFDDRTLAHLNLVISTKLRRHEPFLLSWTIPQELGSGRRSLWIDNGVPIHLRFEGNRSASINPNWLTSMLEAAGAGGGVPIGKEPDPPRNG